MNTFTKIAVIVVMIVAGALLNTFFVPKLVGTPLEQFSIGQLFVVPICYLMLTWLYKKRYTPMKRLAVVVITLSVYCIVANFFKWDRVVGTLIPMLCGALVVYLTLFINKPKVKA
ncbi:hypothetical protein [Bacteroides sp. 51]|uniref:hypothetical protein n=1 Tax=Bacteroides sp. 51 TaxID=2302938 RepID=UPI0013D149AA|nr:hypothetical protein [Bacteroides sp. 51]NDV82466.1 hypothetical protein [Bacteroides sp. 51]